VNLIAGTNIFLAVAMDEPEKAAIVYVTSGAEITGPEILPYEIGNALAAMCKRRQIDPKEAHMVHEITAKIPVRLVAVDIQEALDIALRFNIYAYDAYFLQCAKSQSFPLLTLDRRMIQVARELGIHILDTGDNLDESLYLFRGPAESRACA
jgi:predicted nucleic acid-binding protein